VASVCDRSIPSPNPVVDFFTLPERIHIHSAISSLGMRSIPARFLVMGAKTILFLSSMSPVVDVSKSL
jgi:hypothetical protein